MMNFELTVISLCVIPALFLVQSQPNSEEEIQYYVKLINDVRENATSYHFPTNSRRYQAAGQEIIMETYDFVIVGGGAGGSVVANRLSEIAEWNILLLEAGDYGNNLTFLPYLYHENQFTKFNWGFRSVPQSIASQGCVDHIINYPRGQGIGGSTLINDLIYARGYKADYDDLAKSTSDQSWSYAEVMPYFKKSENYVHRDPTAPVDPKYHGEGGPLRVEYHLPHSPQVDAFFKANQELGIPLVDYNANKIGASPSQINELNGTRFDDGRAFVLPVKSRKNLEISTGSFVTKVEIVNKRAVGVHFTNNGQKFYVKANKEVILSAGAINSPQLLLLSGVGPKEHLDQVGIDTIHELPVGSTFKDHPVFLGLVFETNYTEPVRPLADYVAEFLEGHGPASTAGNQQGLGFYESSFTKGTGSPDIELIMIPANCTNPLSQRSFNLDDQTYEDLWGHIDTTKSFSLYVVATHEASVGNLSLKSKDPYDYPLINPRFLSNKRDIQVLHEGIQLALRLASTNAFKAINTELKGRLTACTEHEYLSSEYWYCAIKQITANLYHPMGTCPMGPDSSRSVVDSKLRVYGLEGLRIIDASIFPETFSGHPNAAVIMTAEKTCDVIKKDFS